MLSRHLTAVFGCYVGHVVSPSLMLDECCPCGPSGCPHNSLEVSSALGTRELGAWHLTLDTLAEQTMRRKREGKSGANSSRKFAKSLRISAIKRQNLALQSKSVLV